MIAREVVEPGTEGLAQLVDAFGEDILLPDGALNRPALAAKAFVDDEQRATLNGIVHPLVGQASRRRSSTRCTTTPSSSRTSRCWWRPGWRRCSRWWSSCTPMRRLGSTRLIERGMDEADARARIKAQATEEQRRAIADVLLDNSGTPGELVEKARDLWYNRVLPLAHNIRTGRCAPSIYQLVPYDPSWPDDARRIVERIETACGAKALRVDHIGSTAVPGMDAKDVIDVQVTVASLDVADEHHRRLGQRRLPSHRPHHRGRSLTPTIRRCGASGFTARPIRAGRRTFMSESTVGQVSSSRCCSGTG